MQRSKAYTLIELLIVITIITMLTALGLPAFAKYQHVTEFTQKAEEVKGLFYTAHAKALTPDNTTITSYQIHYNNSSVPNKYSLVSCSGAVSICDNQTVVNDVVLLKKQTIQQAPPAANGWFLSCNTLLSGGKVTCTLNPGVSSITFRDDNIDPSRIDKFIISLDPFRVDVSPL